MKDVKCPAVVVSKRGRVPDSVLEGERVTVPTFEVASYPQVKFSESKARRYNLIDRAQQRAKVDLQAIEDRNVFNAIGYASTSINPATTVSTTLSRSSMLSAIAEVGKWDLKCRHLGSTIKIELSRRISLIKGQRRGNLESMNKEYLENLYWKEKLNLERIGKIFNCSASFIRKQMMKYNIKRREQYRAHAYQFDKTRKIQFSNEQKQIIYGSMLGDGNLHKHSKGFRFHETHGKNQTQYALWKQLMLSPFVIKSKDTEINTIIHPFLKQVYDLCYNDKKIVSLDFLKLLNAQAIAVWFMDDGCKAGNSVSFCSYSFTKDENLLLQQWLFKKYNIETSIRVRKHKYYELYVRTNSILKFYDLLKPYMLSSMNYKFPNTVETIHSTSKDEDIVRPAQQCAEANRNGLPLCNTKSNNKLVPAKFIMNFSEYVDILTWGYADFDPVTIREILQTGLTKQPVLYKIGYMLGNPDKLSVDDKSNNLKDKDNQQERFEISEKDVEILEFQKSSETARQSFEKKMIQSELQGDLQTNNFVVGHLWTTDKINKNVRLKYGYMLETLPKYLTTIQNSNNVKSMQTISRKDLLMQKSSETTRHTSNIQCPVCDKIFTSNNGLSRHLGSKKDLKHSNFYRQQVDYIVNEFKNKSIWDIEKNKDIFFKKSQINNIVNQYYSKEFINEKSNYNRGWTRGLNKNSDKRLLKLSESISKSLKGRKITWGDKISQTRKNKILSGEIIVHNKGKNKQNYLPLAKMSQTRIRKFEKGLIPIKGGNGFRGFRDDIQMYVRSSFEANFVRILNFWNIKFQYEPRRFKVVLPNNIISSYLPDFIINNKIYELKGYLDDKTKLKLSCFEKQYGIKIHFIFQNGELWKKLNKKYNLLIPKWEYYKRYSPTSVATQRAWQK